MTTPPVRVFRFAHDLPQMCDADRSRLQAVAPARASSANTRLVMFSSFCFLFTSGPVAHATFVFPQEVEQAPVGHEDALVVDRHYGSTLSSRPLQVSDSIISNASRTSSTSRVASNSNDPEQVARTSVEARGTSTGPQTTAAHPGSSEHQQQLHQQAPLPKRTNAVDNFFHGLRNGWSRLFAENNGNDSASNAGRGYHVHGTSSTSSPNVNPASARHNFAPHTARARLMEVQGPPSASPGTGTGGIPFGPRDNPAGEQPLSSSSQGCITRTTSATTSRGHNVNNSRGYKNSGEKNGNAPGASTFFLHRNNSSTSSNNHANGNHVRSTASLGFFLDPPQERSAVPQIPAVVQPKWRKDALMNVEARPTFTDDEEEEEEDAKTIPPLPARGYQKSHSINGLVQQLPAPEVSNKNMAGAYHSRRNLARRQSENANSAAGSVSSSTASQHQLNEEVDEKASTTLCSMDTESINSDCLLLRRIGGTTTGGTGTGATTSTGNSNKTGRKQNVPGYHHHLTLSGEEVEQDATPSTEIDSPGWGNLSTRPPTCASTLSSVAASPIGAAGTGGGAGGYNPYQGGAGAPAGDYLLNKSGDNYGAATSKRVGNKRPSSCTSSSSCCSTTTGGYQNHLSPGQGAASSTTSCGGYRSSATQKQLFRRGESTVSTRCPDSSCCAASTSTSTARSSCSRGREINRGEERERYAFFSSSDEMEQAGCCAGRVEEDQENLQEECCRTETESQLQNINQDQQHSVNNASSARVEKSGHNNYPDSSEQTYIKPIENHIPEPPCVGSEMQRDHLQLLRDNAGTATGTSIGCVDGREHDEQPPVLPPVASSVLHQSVVSSDVVPVQPPAATASAIARNAALLQLPIKRTAAGHAHAPSGRKQAKAVQLLLLPGVESKKREEEKLREKQEMDQEEKKQDDLRLRQLLSNTQPTEDEQYEMIPGGSTGHIIPSPLFVRGEEDLHLRALERIRQEERDQKALGVGEPLSDNFYDGNNIKIATLNANEQQKNFHYGTYGTTQPPLQLPIKSKVFKDSDGLKKQISLFSAFVNTQTKQVQPENDIALGTVVLNEKINPMRRTLNIASRGFGFRSQTGGENKSASQAAAHEEADEPHTPVKSYVAALQQQQQQDEPHSPVKSYVAAQQQGRSSTSSQYLLTKPASSRAGGPCGHDNIIPKSLQFPAELLAEPTPDEVQIKKQLEQDIVLETVRVVECNLPLLKRNLMRAASNGRTRSAGSFVSGVDSEEDIAKLRYLEFEEMAKRLVQSVTYRIKTSQHYRKVPREEHEQAWDNGQEDPRGLLSEEEKVKQKFLNRLLREEQAKVFGSPGWSEDASYATSGTTSAFTPSDSPTAEPGSDDTADLKNSDMEMGEEAAADVDEASRSTEETQDKNWITWESLARKFLSTFYTTSPAAHSSASASMDYVAVYFTPQQDRMRRHDAGGAASFGSRQTSAQSTTSSTITSSGGGTGTTESNSRSSFSRCSSTTSTVSSMSSNGFLDDSTIAGVSNKKLETFFVQRFIKRALQGRIFRRRARDYLADQHLFFVDNKALAGICMRFFEWAEYDLLPLFNKNANKNATTSNSGSAAAAASQGGIVQPQQEVVSRSTNSQNTLETACDPTANAWTIQQVYDAVATTLYVFLYHAAESMPVAGYNTESARQGAVLITNEDREQFVLSIMLRSFRRFLSGERVTIAPLPASVHPTPAPMGILP
ncbi:unnamed protein product [Amoebophrya sp. A120]|nr:unnamed protein product [Amoebophrya sp. A120]|eukprot:GSA120T00013820001.1